eukprot:4402873-Prorocentrum_lima.AAC.1
MHDARAPLANWLKDYVSNLEVGVKMDANWNQEPFLQWPMQPCKRIVSGDHMSKTIWSHQMFSP